MIRSRTQFGTTLVELIITIVVLGIGLSSILLVMNRNISTSSDPLIQHQAIAIAEAYLEEILSKPFVDPDGVGSEAARNLFDNVRDYDDINNPTVNGVPRDQDGNLIPGLGSYTVTVTVTNEAVGPAGNQAPMADSLRVTVAVSTPASATPITVSAYRTNL